MRKHREHIMTSDLRQAYDYLLGMGEADDSFDASESEPAGKNRKRAVMYHYAGRRSYPFAFIVNSGERKDYHLFYIRHPRAGDLDVVLERFSQEHVAVNGSDEITIQVHNLAAAEMMWEVVKKVQLQ